MTIFYVEAFKLDGSQILGTMDGQVPIDARVIRRTLAYKALKRGRRPNGEIVSTRASYWNIVTESGNVIETIKNIEYEPLRAWG